MELLATVIFASSLVAIAFDWIHRTKIALVGAGLVVVLGLLDLQEAIEAVDWATLGLLAGMMIIVKLTERTGIFTYVALRVGRLSKGRPLRLVFLLSGVTALLSAFLDNLTAILLVVPITIALAEVLRVSPIPLALVEVIASNIGGTATLIGDPPNIMIASAVRRLGFVDFIVVLGPLSLIVLLAASTVMYLLFRKQLVVPPERASEIFELDPTEAIRGKPHVTASVAVLVGTIVLFFAHGALNLEPPVVALGGATVLLVLVAEDVEEALSRIEWSTLFFFIGLFVMVGALEHAGVIERIADALVDVTGGSSRIEAGVILWSAALGSALVDNIPFTAAMIPVVGHLESVAGDFDATRWWALAIGACFGGNATAIAAAANVAASGLLERTGHPISFLRFLKVGVPITLLSLAIGTLYVTFVLL